MHRNGVVPGYKAHPQKKLESDICNAPDCQHAACSLRPCCTHLGGLLAERLARQAQRRHVAVRKHLKVEAGACAGQQPSQLLTILVPLTSAGGSCKQGKRCC